MQLSKKKADYKATEDKPNKIWIKNEPIDISKFDIVWDAEITKGKFSGRTARYVYENENSYWQWMVREGLLLDWGLVEPKITSTSKRSTIGFISPSTGECWLGLREVEIEVPNAGVPSCYL